MTIQLTKPIQSYFEFSHTNDPEKFATCFANDAVVLDEGGKYQGHAAIQAWFVKSRQLYQFQVTPLRTSHTHHQQQVFATVSGNFPGSPIQLCYTFLVRDQKIQTLEISASAS